MQQLGYVTKVYEDIAKVVVGRESACGGNCSSCGSSCNVQNIELEVKNTLKARPGDYVELDLKTGHVLKSAVVVYLFPLLMMIIGIILGINSFKSLNYSNYETYGFIIGLVFLGFSYILIKMLDKKIKDKNKLNIKMTRIVDK